MADGETTTFSFTLPQVGASQDSWGEKLNANWQSLDAAITPATISELRSGAESKFLVSDKVYEASEAVELADAATITPDLDAGRNFVVTLTSDRTIANPTNQRAGQSGMLILKKSGSGLVTSFGSNWLFSDAPFGTEFSALPDVVSYYVLAPGEIFCVFMSRFEAV